MMIRDFDPALLSKLYAFWSAACRHRSSGLGFPKDVAARIGGMCEDEGHAGSSWFFEIELPSPFSTWYLNAGFGKHLHRAIDRSCLPERIDNCPNVVFGLGIVIAFTVRPFNPADGQSRNDLASFRFSHFRLHHDFGPLTVFKLGDHSHYLRNNCIVEVRRIAE